MTQRCCVPPTVVAVVGVAETVATIPGFGTFWICWPLSVGPKTVETTLPPASTTYIPALRSATPFVIAPDLTRAWTVHGPAGNVTPPLPGTIHPAQAVGAGDVA